MNKQHKINLIITLTIIISLTREELKIYIMKTKIQLKDKN